MCNLSEALVENTRRDSVRITQMLLKGMSPEIIAERTGYPLSMIEDVQAELDKDQ